MLVIIFPIGVLYLDILKTALQKFKLTRKQKKLLVFTPVGGLTITTIPLVT